jgi:thiamine kinase-like enzyme
VNIQILKDIENTIGGPVIIVREIANNGKSIVCEAISPIGQVAIKTVISNSEFYLNSFLNEISIYKTFKHTAPLCNVPELHYISNDQRTIVLDYLVGEALNTSRYPEHESIENNIKLLRNLRETLQVLRNYNAYTLGTRERILEKYKERWHKYIQRGIYTEADLKILNKLEQLSCWRPEFNHGDPIPSNILLDLNKKIYLIDWELAGAYLPFYDIAVLWAVSLKNVNFQSEIEDYHLSLTEVERLCFATNILNVASRKIWINSELPKSHKDKEVNLTLLRPLLERAKDIGAKVLKKV